MSKILFKFKEFPETRENFPCESFRYIIQIYKYGIEYNLQYRYKDDNEWRDSHTDNYALNITKHFHLGFEHIYYDGPHCFFSLGFIHLGYRNPYGWCDKCYKGNYINYFDLLKEKLVNRIKILVGRYGRSTKRK